MLKYMIVLAHATAVTLYGAAAVIFEMSLRGRKEVDHLIEWWAKSLINFININYKVHNPYNFEFEDGKAYIVMCNHSSVYDIPLSFMAVKGKMRMLAKKEIFKYPLWGRAMEMAGFISIDRRNRRRAIKDLENAKKLMEQGVILWVAPEGSRSKDGGLLPFKKGGFRLAIETGAVIVPLVIIGSHEVHSARTFKVSSGKDVRLYIGKPIDASAYRMEDRDKLLERVRNEIQSLMN